MTSDRTISSLRTHAADVLRRARATPIGSGDRHDLRQLAIGLRWLERNGLTTVQTRVADCLEERGVRPTIILGV